jgi:dihydroflavonol-4-reductase
MHHSPEQNRDLQGKTVLVTGATGLLGSNLVKELSRRGARVRGLVRSPEKAQRFLADVALELVQGDMRAVDGFAAALKGCAAVFHTAAYFREYYRPGSHAAELDAVNIRGTLALMGAAEAAGVECFVHTSSSGTIGQKPDGGPGDEDTPASAAHLKNGYFKSKVDGDREIQAFAAASSMRVIEILPGWMWGPGDAAPTAAGQLALDFVRRKIPIVPSGGTNTVDARDVAQAMVQAYAKAEHGARFIVAGEFQSLEQILETLASLTKVPAPRLHLPYALVMTFAFFEELRAKLTNGPLLISREAISLMHAKPTVSSARAQRELGSSFRPLTETLRDVLTWYEKHGFIEPSQLPGELARAGAAVR